MQFTFADFDRAIQFKTERAGVYFYRGISYGNLRQHEKALADFDHALELNPNYTDAQEAREKAYRLLEG